VALDSADLFPFDPDADAEDKNPLLEWFGASFLVPR
jgi:hypothetical protein